MKTIITIYYSFNYGLYQHENFIFAIFLSGKIVDEKSLKSQKYHINQYDI